MYDVRCTPKPRSASNPPCTSCTDLDDTGGVSARISRKSFASLAFAAHDARRSARLYLQPGSSCKCKDLALAPEFQPQVFGLFRSAGWKEKGSGPGALAKCWKTSASTVSVSPPATHRSSRTQRKHLLSSASPLEDSLALGFKKRHTTQNASSSLHKNEPGDVASVCKSGFDGSANMGINYRNKPPK